eukprot:6197859-Pleurochrysis_carterae.AAC.4
MPCWGTVDPAASRRETRRCATRRSWAPPHSRRCNSRRTSSALAEVSEESWADGLCVRPQACSWPSLPDMTAEAAALW